MVAFNDRPTLICVTMIAVSKAQSGMCKPNQLASSKESRAEAVTRKKSPSRALWRRSHARDCIRNRANRVRAVSRNPSTSCSDVYQGPIHDLMDSLAVGRTAGRARCHSSGNLVM